MDWTFCIPVIGHGKEGKDDLGQINPFFIQILDDIYLLPLFVGNVVKKIVELLEFLIASATSSGVKGVKCLSNLWVSLRILE